MHVKQEKGNPHRKKEEFHNVLEREDQHLRAETCKILTEEVDPHSTQQGKNSMEGSGSECSKARGLLGQESWNYPPLMEEF